MNFLSNVSGRIRALGICAFLGIATLIAAPASGAPVTPSSNRFLFIVDTSAGMKALETPVREALFDLVYSGARGRMTNNDTFGIWMVNDKNDTSFPMEVWRLKNNVELAANVVTALKKQGSKGKARLDLAMSDLGNVIKNVDYLTVVLVSNGETPISGTPFDSEINARFRELAPGMKRAKATLNLALVAQDGQYVAWAVNSPEFLIEIPFVAHKPLPAPVETFEKAVTPPASNTIHAAALPVPSPRIASSPIIITKESVAQERRSYVSAATLPEITRPLTNTIPTAVIQATNPPVAIAPVVVQTNPPSVAAIPVTMPPTNEPAARVPVHPAKSEPTGLALPKASEPMPPTLPLATPAVSIQVSGSSSTLWWAITGGSVTLACVFGIMLLLRGRRREGSLISQSLIRERLKAG